MNPVRKRPATSTALTASGRSFSNGMKRVFVGMSGGVDSSVTAALLKQQGYDVTGVFMKNWTQSLAGFECPWRADLADAQSVAAKLEIPLKIYDFQKEYKAAVVDYMIEEYKAGRTPNPDVMCNQEIKFKLFYNTAIKDGAELVATGHYSRVKDGQLLTAVDDSKDQSYFLYRVESKVLERALMPLGELKKTETRKLAGLFGLSTAAKPDSQGICFVGEIPIKDFLSEYVEPKPGKVIDQHGREIGSHDGAFFYTTGQRHGLDIGGGKPYYVTHKDINQNIVYVTSDLNDPELWRDSFEIAEAHWINAPPKAEATYYIRTRYRGKLQSAHLRRGPTSAQWEVKMENAERAITPGQSAVVYDGGRVLGGGIIV